MILPLLALQANTGAPINGPMLLLTATIDWPIPFTVPLVDDSVEFAINTMTDVKLLILYMIQSYMVLLTCVYI